MGDAVNGRDSVDRHAVDGRDSVDRHAVDGRDSVDRHVELWAKELAWMDPVKEAIFARLAILSRHAAAARRDTLDLGGLKHWQFKVLLMLRRLGPPYAAGPSQLADMLGLTRGALSARLGALERAGLVSRTTEAADRRRVRVRLTPAGYAAFERHASEEERGEAALLAALSERERRTLANLLRKLVVAVEPGSGPPDDAHQADGPHQADGSRRLHPPRAAGAAMQPVRPTASGRGHG